MAAGLAALWLFGRLSNQRAIEEAKRRVAARLYELRLFVDEPKLIWQAQMGLLRDNWRYLSLTLLPGAAVAVPMLLLLMHLEGYYGWEPLRPGQTVLVTLRVSQPIETTLSVPDGFVVETPPVRVMAQRQISWRVRVLRAASGTLRVTSQASALEERISAEPGLQLLATRGAPIQIDYPATNTNWMLWFFGISTATAMLLRRRLRLLF